MAVKASATITLFDVIDIDSVTTYYKLQSSTAAIPAKPTTDTPGNGWTTTEPTYTEGSTNTLYVVIKTKYSDGTFEYTPVSKSSSYEAAKNAYNKAKAAQDSVNNMDIGGRNLVLNSKKVFSNNSYFIGNYDITPHEGGELSSGFGYLIPGEEYTVSICLTPTTDVTSIAVFVSGGYRNLSYGGLNLDGTTNKKVISKTFIAGYSDGRTPSDNPIYAKIELYRLPNPEGKNYGNITIHWIKIEKGNKPTDWTPAPEDVDGDISKAQSTADNAQEGVDQANTSIEEAKASIDLLNDMIAHLVTDENGGSLMTQTGDGWTFNMSSITNNLKAIQEAIENTDIGTINNLTDLVNSIVEKTAYINMTTDDNGNPCIELGKSGNQFRVRITNTAIDFLEGSTRIAYANNNTFYAGKMIVKNELQIGNGPGFVWRTRANGNMGLVYISG